MFARLLTVGVLALIPIVAVSGCATTTRPDSATSTAVVSSAQAYADLESAGLADLDATELITTLERVPRAQRSTEFTASVRPNEVIVTDRASGSELGLDLPDDQFYLSVAPYRGQNHDCYYHSLTTCTGELQGVDVHVLVTDDENGEILIDATLLTEDNGFVGLWVPKGKQAILTVSVGEESASTAISTVNADDPTCVTTLKLG